jgi:hypothetical protein
MSPINARTATNAEAFKALLEEALINSSIQYILCLFNSDRKLLFELKRNPQNVVSSIFYDNLGRGLPAARDIKEILVGIASLSREAVFVDTCSRRNINSHFGGYTEVSTATGGMFGKISERVEVDLEFAKDLEKAGINSESISLAVRDFDNKFVHKHYPMPTIGQMESELINDAELNGVDSLEAAPRFTK